MSKRFHDYHPDPPDRPSLKERIIALEKESGQEVFLRGGKLSVRFDTTENPDYPRSEEVVYSLSREDDPNTGVVEWVLLHNDKFYLFDTVLKRPDLKRVVVTSNSTTYKGVKVDGNVYWTNSGKDLVELKSAVDALARAQRQIVELLKED